MIKVRPVIDINDLKCGIIYRNNEALYNVLCESCHKIISFVEFKLHFETLHIPSPLISLGETDKISIDDEDIEKDPLQDYDILISKANAEINDRNKAESEPKFLNELLSLLNEIGEVPSDSETDDNEESSINDYDNLLKNNLQDDTEAEEVNGKVDSNIFSEYSGESDDDEKSLEDNITVEKTLKKTKGKTQFFCDICDAKYPSRRDLTNHKKRVHNYNAPKCTECGKEHPDELELERHMYKHKGFICNICGKTFRSWHPLNVHKLKHSRIKPFKCQECDFATYTKCALKNHINGKHSNTRSYICEICGKGFYNKPTLTRHMMRHSDKRPATCDICGKSFRLLMDLRRHVVVHNSEKSFRCDLCGKAFLRKRGLHLHTMWHRGDAKHECTLCDKKFIDITRLKKHIRFHERISKMPNKKKREQKSQMVALHSEKSDEIDLDHDREEINIEEVTILN